jgi:hypothetical protein
MEIRALHLLATVAPLQPEMDELNRTTGRKSPFSTFEFIENFVRHDEFFPDGLGRELWFLAAFEQGRLLGYLPMQRVCERPLGKLSFKMELLITHDSDQQQVVASAADEARVTEAIYQFLLGHQRDWSFLEIWRQEATSPLCHFPAGRLLGDYHLRFFPSAPACTIPVKWTDLGEYLSDLGHEFRRSLRRSFQRLSNSGRVRVIGSDDPSALPAMLDLYRSVEPVSWQASVGGAISRDPRRVEFFRGLIRPEQPMRIHIQLLLQDDRPIAGIINGQYESSLYALQSAYDQRAHLLGPGTALLLTSVKKAIEERFRYYDLLLGFAHHKTRWLAQTTETRHVQLFRSGSAYDYRARLGDLKRRLFPRRLWDRPEVPTREDAKAETPTALACPPPSTDREIQALLGEVFRHRVEVTEVGELLVAMSRFRGGMPAPPRNPPFVETPDPR